jgi:hypothetical protein
LVENAKTEPHKELTGSGTSVLREGMRFVHISDTRDIILEDGRPLYCTRIDAPTDSGSTADGGEYKHYFTLQNTVKMFRLAEGGADLKEFTEMVRQSVRENSSLKDDADRLFYSLGKVKKIGIPWPKDSEDRYLLVEEYASKDQENLETTLLFSFDDVADRGFSRAVVPFLLHNGYHGWTRDTRESVYLTEYLFITPLSDLKPTAIKRLNRDGTEKEDDILTQLAEDRATANYERNNTRRSGYKPPKPKPEEIQPLSLPKVQIIDHRGKADRQRYEDQHIKNDLSWTDAVEAKRKQAKREQEMERWTEAMAKRMQEKREKAEMERRPKKIGEGRGRGYFVNA